MAADRETVEALARKYRDPGSVARTFALAVTHFQSALGHLGIGADEAVLFERLASRVLGTDRTLGASAATIAANELGQSGLWPHAISGDLPILLVRVVGDDDAPLVRQVLQAQEYWRLKGLSADVVILNEHPASYLDEMQAQLTDILNDGPWSTWLHRPGGAYLLRGDRMGRAERVLVEAVARAVLHGDRGDLRTQLARPESIQTPAPPLIVTAPPNRHPGGTPAMPPMTLTDGRSGFTNDGRSYAVALGAGEETPLPWANVIANRHFGTIVTASGSAFTWSGNSRENRLTAFANDPWPTPRVRPCSFETRNRARLVPYARARRSLRVRQVSRSTLRRAHAVLRNDQRHRSRTRRLRRRGRPGQVLAARRSRTADRRRVR